MYEPIGGSAPKYTGKNIINPLASILAGGMMLEFLGEEKGAQLIEGSVQQAIKKEIKSLSAGYMGLGTKEVGDLIVEYVKKG
jgi:3-isopropylmalate dehydrogenase